MVLRTDQKHPLQMSAVSYPLVPLDSGLLKMLADIEAYLAKAAPEEIKMYDVVFGDKRPLRLSKNKFRSQREYAEELFPASKRARG